MTEKVLEQKIDELTQYVKNLDVSSKADDDTYKSILSKIAYRLDELESDEDLNVVEIKDRIKFLTAQIDDIDQTKNITELTEVVTKLRENQEKEFVSINENIENSRNYQEENLARLNDVISKIEDLQTRNCENVNNIINEIKDDLNRVRENTQNSSNISEELKNSVYDAIQNIEYKFNDIINSQNNAQDEYKDIVINNLNDIKGQLWDTENNIKNSIKSQFVDYSNEIDIPNKLEYLAQTISTINKDTADIVGEVESLKYTSQETSDNTLAVREYLDSTKDDLRNNLRELQEQFVLQMLQVFDNISFSSETEEIIDFVDESSYAIKSELDTLKNEINKISNKDDSAFFNEHFNNLCDLVNKQTNTEFNLLKEVASEIRKITANNENSDEYTYSLPDVENDLAKIRLILKELQSDKLAKDEKDIDFSQRFELLNEDISSISKRTNKLILTAEETNKKFKSYLDEFKGIMDGFSVRNRQPYIEQKLDNATRLIVSNAKSAQILNEAFMHFAQWIDETSEALANNGNLAEINNEKVEQALFEMEQVKRTAQENEQKISQRLSALEDELKNLNANYEAKLDENKELQMTIEKQNKLISKLEQRIESFGQVEAKVDVETKSVIEYIASQTGITAENTQNNKDLSSKLEFLEHKISSLDKNIQKIISYIDED